MNATSFYHTNTTDAPGNNTIIFDQYARLTRSLHIMSLIVYSLAFVLGLLGNGLVIWVAGFKMKKTINTVWFLNLAAADFLFTAFLPLHITYLAMGFHWPFGQFMCKMNSTVAFLNMFASVYILVVISVDRCVSVVWPIWAQNHRTVRKASCVSVCVWVLALILSLPYFIFRDILHLRADSTICFNSLDLLGLRAMTITRFVMGFVIPFTVIVSCYFIIIHRLRRNPVLASQSSRPFKIIAAIIITFFLCWSPFHIMGLIELSLFTTVKPSETLRYVIIVGIPLSTSLAFLNSCLNPLLYVFVGQDFKDKIRKSILNVLETAFQEDETHSQNLTKSEDSSRSKHQSDLNAAV